MAKEGMLITFEGGEGSGKTTASKSISEHLTEIGVEHLLLREPGGTSIGNQIREIAVENKNNIDMKPETETLLFQASRAQITNEIILPYVEKGGLVLLDRYIDSSIAYQGYARGVGASKIEGLNNFSTKGLLPDLTLWFDVEPKIGLNRRRDLVGFTGADWNRLDAMELSFHEKVRYAYSVLHWFDQENRWVRVDANQSIDEVFQESMKIIESKLIMRGFLEGQISNPERRG